jgi:rubredoxin
METNFENNKKEIVEQLGRRVSQLKCPVCGHQSFELGGGYFAHDLQEDLQSRKIGGVNIPTVPLVCKHCGYILEFAVGTLGLLPKKENKPTDKKSD